MNSQAAQSNEDLQVNQTSCNIIGLLQIVQNLIILGLNSVDLWHSVVSRLKTHNQFCSNPEMMNLQLLLTQISQHISSRLFEFFPNDLSQQKLPDLLLKAIPSNTLLKVIKPLLKKKNFVDKLFSLEASSTLNSVVEEILSSIKQTVAIESLDNYQDEEETVNLPAKQHFEKSTKKTCSETFSDSEDDYEINKVSSKRSGASTSKLPAKKPRFESLPRCSSPSDSDSSKDDTNVSESDYESDSSKFDKLFKVKSVKKGPLKIKQIFQTQKRNIRKKLTTPGEEGRYMVKIELTDTKDLKNCKSPSLYWTKVSTKTVFLTESKSGLFKQINNILYDAGSKIKSIPGTECEQSKVEKKSS